MEELKKSNPDGRFWIKLDATDVKGALMESGRRVWNGDVDMGDGEVAQLRKDYEERLEDVEHMTSVGATKEGIARKLMKVVNALERDNNFLYASLEKARKTFREKFNRPGTSEDSLKNLNWEVVECQTLLDEAQEMKVEYEELLSHLNPTEDPDENVLHACLRNLQPGFTKYARNLFKKKRKCATHVLVTMLSDERRSQKPYALPVRYIPYHSIRDQYVWDINRELKEKMLERNLNVVGM